MLTHLSPVTCWGWQFLCESTWQRGGAKEDAEWERTFKSTNEAPNDNKKANAGASAKATKGQQPDQTERRLGLCPRICIGLARDSAPGPLNCI